MKHSEALEREKPSLLAFPVLYETAHYLTAVGLIFSE